MPIFSLVSDEGIGTLGKPARDFIDFMANSGLTVWQVLPVTPTGYGNSPYQSCSADALNYYLIDLAQLVEDGCLSVADVVGATLSKDCSRVDYGLMFYNKTALLKKAFKNFNRGDENFTAFVNRGEFSDFSVFMALKEKFSYKCWNEWDEPYRTYNAETIKNFAESNKDEVLFWQFTQYIFCRQWKNLSRYASEKGVYIMGDIPLYLSYDSVEMWKYGNKIFKVDEDRIPEVVAGAPPDAFSETGQLWGNPMYDWEKMEKDGYSWWNGRLKRALDFYDIIRLDHFRGFDRCYAVPYGETTAINGHWENGPSFGLFKDKLDWNVVVEDLGVLDEGVYELLRKTGYTGMRELEFAFDGRENNEHKPSNYTKNLVCYTGTHDNEPLCGYIEGVFGDKERYALFLKDLTAECERYDIAVGITADAYEDISDEISVEIPADGETARMLCEKIIELGYAADANIVIIPLWDFLALGSDARINLPGTQTDKNWSWRAADKGYLSLSGNLAALAKKYKRK